MYANRWLVTIQDKNVHMETMENIPKENQDDDEVGSEQE